MKKILRLSLVLVLINLYCSVSRAQETTQGVINYKVDVDSDNPQIKEMLQDSRMTLSFKQGKSRADMDMGVSKNTTLTDGDKTEVLIEVMGNKYKMNIDKNKENTKMIKDDSYDVNYTTDTMTIAGYLCKKAIIKTKEGGNYNIFTTDVIKANNGSFPYKKVKGFPLKFSMDQHGIAFSCTATSVDLTTPVSDDVFKVDDKDYQELTQDQIMKMSGGK